MDQRSQFCRNRDHLILRYTSEEALAFFNHFNEERKKAVAMYSENYAPLTLDMLQQEETHWNWATEPWPWEGGIC